MTFCLLRFHDPYVVLSDEDVFPPPVRSRRVANLFILRVGSLSSLQIIHPSKPSVVDEFLHSTILVFVSISPSSTVGRYNQTLKNQEVASLSTCRSLSFNKFKFSLHRIPARRHHIQRDLPVEADDDRAHTSESLPCVSPTVMSAKLSHLNPQNRPSRNTAAST